MTLYPDALDGPRVDPKDVDGLRVHIDGVVRHTEPGTFRDPLEVRYVVAGESTVREATLSGDLALLWRLAVPGVYVGPLCKARPGEPATALRALDGESGDP